MRVSFYVSGKAGRLREIIKTYPEVFFESVKLVVCDNLKNDDLKDILKLNNIEFVSFDYNFLHEDRKQRSQILSDKINGLFHTHKIDYCFCFGAHILKGEILRDYENKIINFHPSILPSFPGIKSIDQAVSAGAKVLGNTAHFIDAGIDTGPIIMQNVVSVSEFETGGYEKVLNRQLPMFRQIFEWLKEGKIQVKNRKVIVDNGDYSTTAFYPKTKF